MKDTHTYTYVTSVTNGSIKVTLNSLPDQQNFTNKYHISHHLLILCFQFQQIQTEKEHQYKFYKRTVNSIFLLDIFSIIFTSHAWNFISLGYNTISIWIRNTSANIVIKFLPKAITGIDMKRLVYFYLHLS